MDLSERNLRSTTVSNGYDEGRYMAKAYILATASTRAAAEMKHVALETCKRA